MSLLDYILNFYLYLISSRITSLVMKGFILILTARVPFFHQKVDVPFKLKVIEYLF